VHDQFVISAVQIGFVAFNSSLKGDFQGSRVTSDGGPILVRKLHDRLAVPWPGEALGTANATNNCVQRWSGVHYRWGRKSI